MLLFQRKYSYLIKENLPASETGLPAGRQELNQPAGEAGIEDWRFLI